MSKNALVLGGGGGKGSYEIGVWKGLIKLGWDFQTVTGSSVGALNAALIIQNDYEFAENLWLTIDNSMVMETTNAAKLDESMDILKTVETFFKSIPQVETGISTEPLGKLLREIVDEEKIRSSKVNFGLITVLMESRKLSPKGLFIEDIPQGSLVDYLWASSSFFPALKYHLINDKKYIDGGYFDNIPVNLALEKETDAVLAVDLDAIGFSKEPNLKPQQELITIKPFWGLGPIFNFSDKTNKRNINLGYLDTLKTFNAAKGCYFTFDNKAFTACSDSRNQKILKIIERINNAEKNTLVSLVADNVTKIVEAKYRNKYSIEKNLLEIGAEAAGKIFDIEPDQCYSESEYILEITTRVKAYILEQKVFDDFGFSKAKALKKKLSSLDDAGRTMLLLKYLNSADTDSPPLSEEALVLLFPHEFTAAAFLWIIDIDV